MIESSTTVKQKFVKLADLRHNSDLKRMNKIDDSVMERYNKYHTAIRFLEEN